MTVHFASSEDIDFSLNGGATATTSANGRDGNYVRTSMYTDSGKNFDINLPSAISTCFVSWRSYIIFVSGSALDAAPATMYEGSTPVARIKTTDGVWSLQTWDGGWVNRVNFSSPPLAAASINHFTFKLVLHASAGEISVWLGDTQVATWTGDTIGDTGATGIDKINFRSARPDGNGDTWWNEFIVADEQTINMRVATAYPNADGANTDWANGWASVDEALKNDGDVINTDTVDQVETMNVSPYNGSSELVVRAVFVSARALRGLGGPQNLQLAVREGVTEDFSASKSLGEVYATYRDSWEINPDTGLAWEVDELANLEVGVKSIT